jgi:hypothetical protein
MLRSSHAVHALDLFRVPYRIVDEPPGDGLGTLRGEHTDGVLAWARGSLASGSPARHRLNGLLLPCRVASDGEMTAALRTLGRAWEPHEPVLDPSGSVAGHVFRNPTGGVALPFDVDEPVRSMLSERHAGAEKAGGGAAARRAALGAYYRLRPLIPRPAQIALRRRLARIQGRREFPRWPLETALHDLYDWTLQLACEVADAELPAIAPWPGGRRWALVLTHDVETAVGYRNIHLMRGVEEELGFRSSWNLIPRRDYTVDEATVRDLAGAGFEVGVHGLFHDGRDLESPETFERRLPEMRSYAERWGAVGFRSPATHRDWGLMSRLGFDYDSSFPDTDPYEPQPGGCCSLLPFEIGDVVELPITLPQDHTLFVILRREDETVWVEKTEAIRGLGGLALLDAHPDYMLEPRLLDLYRRFLHRYRDDDSVWHALPREVAGWWRRRAQSRIEPGPGGSWQVVGPSSGEATVETITAR